MKAKSTKIKPKNHYNTNFQKKFCSLRISHADIHYLNHEGLSKYTTHMGSIMCKYRTGHNTKYQKLISKHIKIARFLGLMPYTI